MKQQIKKEVSTKDSDYENNNQIETSNNITDKRKIMISVI